MAYSVREIPRHLQTPNSRLEKSVTCTCEFEYSYRSRSDLWNVLILEHNI